MAHNIQPRVAAVARGVGSGLIGTAAMTAWHELSAKLRSSNGDSASAQEDDRQPADPWEQASAPAQAARWIARTAFDTDLSADLIPVLTHAMHWGYGTSWGALYGLASRRSKGRRVGRDLAFGTAVWGASYAQLVPMGLYQPPWKYPPKELAMDLSYHLVYGLGLALGYRAIASL